MQTENSDFFIWTWCMHFSFFIQHYYKSHPLCAMKFITNQKKRKFENYKLKDKRNLTKFIILSPLRCVHPWLVRWSRPKKDPQNWYNSQDSKTKPQKESFIKTKLGDQIPLFQCYDPCLPLHHLRHCCNQMPSILCDLLPHLLLCVVQSSPLFYIFAPISISLLRGQED